MLLCSFTKKKTGRTWQYFSRLLSRHFSTRFDHVLKCSPSGVHCLMYHDPNTFDDQIWKNFVFKEEMTSKMQPSTG